MKNNLVKKKPILIITKKIWDKKNYKIISKKNFFLLKKVNFTNIKKIQPKIIFFIHWSKIIKKEIFKNFECIQFHSSDLPFGKGGSPIQNQILMGIKNTKISAFKINEKIDDGPIIMKKKLKLIGPAQEIYINIEKIALEMIVEISKMKKLIYKKQKGKAISFKRRTKKESEIKFHKINSIKQLYDHIRMLDAKTYPKAFIKLNSFTGYLDKAKLKNGKIKSNIEFIKNDKK